MKIKSTSRLAFPLASAIAALLASSSVLADQIWDGGSLLDSNWNTAANWGSDGLPIFTNAITFVGNTRNGAVNNILLDPALGGNPAAGMDPALLPTIELVTDPVSVPAIPAGNYLLFTYRRSDLSVAAGVTVDCETDTDLVAPWTAATGAPGVVIQVDDNFTFSPPAAADTDRVRVYVPRGANPKLFGRLNAVVP